MDWTFAGLLGEDGRRMVAYGVGVGEERGQAWTVTVAADAAKVRGVRRIRQDIRGDSIVEICPVAMRRSEFIDVFGVYVPSTLCNEYA